MDAKWLVRDMEGNAIGLLKNTPMIGVLDRGGGCWLMKVTDDGPLLEYTTVNSIVNAVGTTLDTEEVVRRTATCITEAEFESYTEFELFDE